MEFKIRRETVKVKIVDKVVDNVDRITGVVDNVDRIVHKIGEKR